MKQSHTLYVKIIIGPSYISSLHELSKDVVEDTTVLVVSELRLGIDSDLSLEFLSRASVNVNYLTDLEFAAISGNVEGLLSGEAERLSILAGEELKREDTHADEVRSVDALV